MVDTGRYLSSRQGTHNALCVFNAASLAVAPESLPSLLAAPTGLAIKGGGLQVMVSGEWGVDGRKRGDAKQKACLRLCFARLAQLLV